jgi:YesN/AraC family two-component response regulator
MIGTINVLGGNMLRLMIVDDEEIIRNSLSKIADWNSIGYELIAIAKDGMEAYDVICDSYPDVVITDLKMPVLDGIELIERAIELDKTIQFIILSGYGEFEYAKKAMKYGVNHYLLKPTNKQQVLDALLSIKQGYDERLQLHAIQQNVELKTILFTLEKCFIMEALNCPDDLINVIMKYQKILTYPKNYIQSCICAYLEEKHLRFFIQDLNKICKSLDIQLLFPVIYVKNIAVLILKCEDLAKQSRFTQKIECLHYKNQLVSFEVQMHLFDHFQDLLENILWRIRRYSKILLYSLGQEPQEIQNSNVAYWKIDALSLQLQSTFTSDHVISLLNDTFQEIIDLDNAIAFSISLSLRLKTTKYNLPYDPSDHLIEELQVCSSVYDVKIALQKNVLNLLFAHKDETSVKNSIEDMKNYVANHLDASHLSLKWLAENYLFISPGYLSKQFIKEEGERFSDYLNRQRMEKAKQLLLTYNSSNIKDIANKVGFGNNPRYFSQVFKRYTGLTPSDYLN